MIDRYFALGVSIDSAGSAAVAADLHPDAERAHEWVNALTLKDRVVGLAVLFHARAGTRPELKGPQRWQPAEYKHDDPNNGPQRWQPAEYKHDDPNNGPRYDYDYRVNGKKAWWCRIKLRPHAESITYSRQFYARWHAALVAMQRELTLRNHKLTGPSAPDLETL